MSLRAGIVGCGDIYEHHARAWTRVPGCELAGIYDIDQDLTRRLVARGGAGRAFGSLEELLASCDVVDLCTPPDSHLTIALAALDAGCHLLIEKPVLMRLADWRTLEERARTRGRKLAALHNQKFFNVFTRAKRWIDAGRIGRLLRIHDEYLVTPANNEMLGHRGHWSHRMPGGRWMETLPHNLYLLHHFAGPLELEGIVALQGPGVSPGAPVDELVITLAGGGCIATLHFSSNCNLDRRTLTYTGSDGVIEVVPAGRIALCSRTPLDFAKKALGIRYVEALKTLGQMIPDRLDFVRDQTAKLDAHGRNVAAYVEFVSGRGPSPTPDDEIAYVIRLCEQIGAGIDARIAAARPVPVSV